MHNNGCQFPGAPLITRWIEISSKNVKYVFPCADAAVINQADYPSSFISIFKNN